MINREELEALFSADLKDHSAKVIYRGGKYEACFSNSVQERCGYETVKAPDDHTTKIHVKPSTSVEMNRSAIIHGIVETDLREKQGISEERAHEMASRVERDIAIEKCWPIRKIAMLGVDKAPEQSDFFFFDPKKHSIES